VRGIRSSTIQEWRTLLQGEGGASRQLAGLMSALWLVAPGRSRCCRCLCGTVIRATPRRLAPVFRLARHTLSPGRHACCWLQEEAVARRALVRPHPASKHLPQVGCRQSVPLNRRLHGWKSQSPEKNTVSLASRGGSRDGPVVRIQLQVHYRISSSLATRRTANVLLFAFHRVHLWLVLLGFTARSQHTAPQPGPSARSRRVQWVVDRLAGCGEMESRRGFSGKTPVLMKSRPHRSPPLCIVLFRQDENCVAIQIPLGHQAFCTLQIHFRRPYVKRRALGATLTGCEELPWVFDLWRLSLWVCGCMSASGSPRQMLQSRPNLHRWRACELLSPLVCERCGCRSSVCVCKSAKWASAGIRK